MKQCTFWITDPLHKYTYQVKIIHSFIHSFIHSLAFIYLGPEIKNLQETPYLWPRKIFLGEEASHCVIHVKRKCRDPEVMRPFDLLVGGA